MTLLDVTSTQSFLLSSTADLNLAPRTESPANISTIELIIRDPELRFRHCAIVMRLFDLRVFVMLLSNLWISLSL